MKRYAPLLLALAAACGSAEDRLAGKWEIDIATLNLSPSFRELPQDQKQRVVAETRWNLEFKDDKLSWSHAMWGWGSEAWIAKYKVLDSEGNRVTLEIDRPGKRPGKKMKLVATVTDEKLQFSMQGRSIILKRKTEKEKKKDA